MIITHDPHIYIALNKPVDYATDSTYKEEKNIFDLIPEITEKVYPVGQLDNDSEGLMLLTNDKKLVDILTNQKNGCEKEYEITITLLLSKDACKILERGMMIDGEEFGGIKISKIFNNGKRIIITIIIQEEKKYQIKKMFARLGYTMHSLKRTRIGKLKLGTLATGEWKYVNKKQII